MNKLLVVAALAASSSAAAQTMGRSAGSAPKVALPLGAESVAIRMAAPLPGMTAAIADASGAPRIRVSADAAGRPAWNLRYADEAAALQGARRLTRDPRLKGASIDSPALLADREFGLPVKEMERWMSYQKKAMAGKAPPLAELFDGAASRPSVEVVPVNAGAPRSVRMARVEAGLLRARRPAGLEAIARAQIGERVAFLPAARHPFFDNAFVAALRRFVRGLKDRLRIPHR